MSLFAAATAEDGQQIALICRVTNKVLVCTAVCALKEIVGADIEEFAIKSHKEAAKRALEKVAKETANKFVKKGVPVLNVIDTIGDVYGTIVCTVNCVREE